MRPSPCLSLSDCLLLAITYMCGAARSRPMPTTHGLFGNIATKFSEYEVIVEPDKNEAEWWAGAPSVARDNSGTFWLACRMRTADTPRGLRGYEIRVLWSRDCIHFEKARSMRREDVPIPGFERPALLIDPKTGLFKLYACGPWKDGPGSIIKFKDTDEPTAFDPHSAKVVIGPLAKSDGRDVIPVEYKNPVILQAAGTYHYLRNRRHAQNGTDLPFPERRRRALGLCGGRQTERAPRDLFLPPVGELRVPRPRAICYTRPGGNRR